MLHVWPVSLTYMPWAVHRQWRLWLSARRVFPRVHKIIRSPANRFVMEAKQLACYRRGTALDMPAGPSEVMVIADRDADPAFIASDFLSQAEHGPDSQSILLTDSAEVLEAICKRNRKTTCCAPARRYDG